MRYGYLCPQHGSIDSDCRSDFIYCPYCHGCIEAKRDWRFRVDLSFEPYFAPSFGTVVKSRTHAKDLAKIASEEATLRTGVPHDFTVVDTHDDAAVGINTDEKKAELTTPAGGRSTEPPGVRSVRPRSRHPSRPWMPSGRRRNG